MRAGGDDWQHGDGHQRQAPPMRECKGKVVVVGDYSSGKTSLVHRYGTGNYLGIQEPTIAAAFQTKVVDLSHAPPIPHNISSSVAGGPSQVARSFVSPTRGLTAATVDGRPQQAAGGSSSSPRGRLANRRTSSVMERSATGPLHESQQCAVKLEIWDTAGSERYQSLMPMYFRDASVALLVLDVTRRSTFDNVSRWYDAYLQHNDGVARPELRAVIVAAKCDLYAPSSTGDPSKEMGGPDLDLEPDTPRDRDGGSSAVSPRASFSGAASSSASASRASQGSRAAGRPPPSGSTFEMPEVSVDEIVALGDELGLPVCFTSAKADWNVQLLFRDVAVHIAGLNERLLRQTGGGGGFGLRNGLRNPASLLLRDDPMKREIDNRGERHRAPDMDEGSGRSRKKCC